MTLDDDNIGNENDAQQRICIPTTIDSTLINSQSDADNNNYYCQIPSRKY